jgi:N-glycosyltransferase
MRILIATLDSRSHLRTLVPLALTARAAGHDVVVAGAENMGAEVTSEYGLEFTPSGLDWPNTPAGEFVGQQLAFGAGKGFVDALIKQVFLGEYGLKSGHDILEFAQSWQPDVIVRVAEEFGGYLAAEKLGIPHVAVASGDTHQLQAADIKTGLRKLRAKFGLPDEAEPDPYRYLLASFTPPGYSPELTAAATLRHYRQTQPERAGEQLPDWVAGLPADQPLVFAAFGSVLSELSWKLGPVTANIVKALSEIDCQAVIAAGVMAEELAGQVPEHLHIVESIAQPLLIETTDLFITHAGFASVREALRAGTPMVAVPSFGDQPYQAGRCAELGLARVVSPTAGPKALMRACTEVLTEPSYAHAARRVARGLATLPGVPTLVEDVAKIATSGQVD